MTCAANMNLYLRICFLMVSFCMFHSDCFAQKEILYEQYIQNPMAINPAFTGARDDFNMSVLLRRRWFLIPNAPITQSFSMDGTVANGKIGLGLQALNDRMSPYYTTGVYGSGAYHWQASVAWKISFGLQGGINVLPVYDFATNTSQNRALASLGQGYGYSRIRYMWGYPNPSYCHRDMATGRIYSSTVSPYSSRRESLLSPMTC